MTAWRWVSLEVLLAVHDRLLAEHGGAQGVRDRGLIESALARPRNRESYAGADAAQIAAAYLWGLARGHGFIDGNKRVAWTAARLFLADNGYALSFDRAEAVHMVEGVASGGVSEAELAHWLASRMREGG